MNTNENLEQNIITVPANVDFSSRVKQGDVNLRAGDVGDKLSGVMIDRVQLSWYGDCVRTIGPGSYLGVGALVDPEHRRSATAAALCDSELLGMNRDEFRTVPAGIERAHG